jgi:hypothetical protein
MKRFLRSLLTGTSDDAANAAVDILFIIAALMELAFCLSAAYGIYQPMAAAPGARDGPGLLIVFPVVMAGGLLVGLLLIGLTQKLLGSVFSWWETTLVEVNEDEELYRLIRERDGEVVVDVLTPLEMLFAAPGVVGAALVVLGGAWFLYNQTAETFMYPVYGVPLLVAGAVLGRMMEVNLRIDLAGKTLQIYRRLHRWEWRHQICDFSQIHCVTMDGRYKVREEHEKCDRSHKSYRSRKKHRSHEVHYGLVIVLNNGKVVRAVDRDFRQSTTVESHGQRLASILGVPYRRGAGILKVRRTPAGVALEWKTPGLTTFSEKLGGGCAAIFFSLMLLGAAVSTIRQHYPGFLEHKPARPVPTQAVPSTTPTQTSTPSRSETKDAVPG